MVTGDSGLKRLLRELFHLIGSLPSQLYIFILRPWNPNREACSQKLLLVSSASVSALPGSTQAGKASSGAAPQASGAQGRLWAGPESQPRPPALEINPLHCLAHTNPSSARPLLWGYSGNKTPELSNSSLLLPTLSEKPTGLFLSLRFRV